MIERALLEKAAAAIRSADALTLACHVGPDGDALGSMLALATAAMAEGKRVHPTYGEPFVIADQYRFLPVDLLVPSSDVPKEPDVMVVFDVGSLDRLGEVAKTAENAQVVVVIDHHVTNAGFGDVAVVVPDASSTAEIVLALIRHLGWPITPTVATCLLTGIVTDTGRFQYSNTRPPTLHAAAQLVAAGARPEVIGRHIYEETPFGYLTVASAVLGRAVLEAEKQFVWTWLQPEDLTHGGVDKGDVDALIDLVRLPRESDVALLITVVDEETVRGSLRSRGRVDVGGIAAELGGGGHHNAAGFTLKGQVEDAVSAVRSRLP